MKSTYFKRITYATMALCFLSVFSFAQNTITTPRAASPAAKVSQTIGISKVTIKYSRPAVNGREGKIWGQLVPYGFTVQGFGNGKPIPWRAGANENTVIHFSDDVKIEGKDLKAGTYGLHMAVYENNEVEVIFSENTTSWGSYWYEESEDALRVKVQSVENAFTERLTYDFTDITPTSTTAVLDWENKRIPFKVEFAVHDLVVANAKNQLKNTQGFGFQGPLSAANYCIQNKVHLDQAEKWVEQAIAAQRDVNTLSTKARLHLAKGDPAAAMTAMEEALAEPTAQAPHYYNYGRQLIGQDMDDKALEVFKKLSKKWPDHWLAEHGMARGYSAAGDYKKALKYERVALEKAPAGSKQFLEGFIKTLEEGKDFN